MDSNFLVVILLGFLISDINFVNCRYDMAKLSRRKRYVAFPEGATLSVAICMTTQMIWKPRVIFVQGNNWGISYDLPNNTRVWKDYILPSRHVMQRRQRRDLYQKIETVMDSMGYDGRGCIHRALCEAGALLSSRTTNVIEEILGIIFRFPTQKVLETEPSDIKDYHSAHFVGKIKGETECAQKYQNCPFSLIDAILGLYSEYTSLFL